MTQLLRSWFEERAGEVPPPLRDRLRAIVDTVGETAGEADTVGQQVQQQVQQMEGMVALQLDRIRERQCTERRDALDLLTTDALMSYMLEFAASLGPELLDELAGKLMRLAAGCAVSRVPGATC